MNTLQLRYDHQCPLCRSFAKLLRRKLDTTQIDLVPMTPQESQSATEFALATPEGELYGAAAVDYLAQHYPQVQNLFWMLPAAYQKPALVKGYNWAQKLRRWMRRTDCNC